MPSWVAPTRVRRAACAACPAAWPCPHEPEIQTRPCHQTAFIEQLVRVLRRGASVCQLLVERGGDSQGPRQGVGGIHGPWTIGAPLSRWGDVPRSASRVPGDSRAAQAAETRKRIVAAAREVFTEVGYEAATFQAIAVRADQTLSARHCHPDATERPYFALMFRAGRRVHGRWQCPRCSTCLARGRRSIRRPRCES